jgi:hypothetical protein
MKLTYLFFILFTLNATANYVGIENNFRTIGKIQTDDQGSTNFMEFSPGVVMASSLPMPYLNNTWFYPSAAIFFPERSEDDLYSKWTAELNFHLLNPITDSFDIIYGGTYLMNLIVGAGGTSVQNNGTSSSTYYVPEESKFVAGFIPEVGVRYEFWRAKYIYLGVLTHHLFDDDARSFTLSLNLLTWI